MQAESSVGLKWLLGVAAFFIILAALKSAEAIFVPIMLALFISIICAPFLVWLTQRGLPTSIAIVIILVVLFLFGTLMAIFVGASVDTLSERLPEYQQRLLERFEALIPVLVEHGFPVSRDEIMSYLSGGIMVNFARSALGSLGAMFTNVFLIVFIVIFLLLEGAVLSDKVRLAFGENAFKPTAGVLAFMKQVNKYLLIKGIISFITGTLVTLFLWWRGVDFPLMWGLVAMLMNFIPNVGSLLAAIPAVLLTLVQFGLPDALIVAAGYVAVNTIMGNLIEPRFMGDNLGLSPLVVFLSLIVWGWLFGIIGMFLSIPITMILKLALEHNQATKWIAVLMGSGKAAQAMLATMEQEERKIGLIEADQVSDNQP